MKTKLTEKQKAGLVNASRVALQNIQLNDFWVELEARMDRREASDRELVEKRPTRTI